MRKKIITAALLSVSILAFASCSQEANDKKENTTTFNNETSSGNDQKETPTSESPTSEEPTTPISYEGDINSLSSEIISWGVGTQLNADGRPSSPVQFQEKYKKYAVDFIKEDEKVIYLTFDEGYENGYTGQILDTLKEKGVKAVFFITMPYAKTESDLIKRMVEEGHILGAHSVTHPANGMPSLTLEQQENEYKQLHEYVLETYGYEMYLFRPPAGIFSEQSLAVAQKCGYRSVLWSFAYADWDPEKQPSEETGLEKTIGKLHNGAVYLLHAVSKTNTNILGRFIDGALEQGYVFKEYTK